MSKHVAIYVRVSSKQQKHASQLLDLERWAKAQSEPVKWYTDKATGKNMQRKDWQRLEEAMRAGKVSQLVCWRIDRLGRMAKGLTALFEELRERKINLVSIKDGIDLATSAGRMIANVIASIAQYENEMRSERVLAGQEVARSLGKTWGGSAKGKAKKVTSDQCKAIHQLHADKTPISRIAKTVHLSRPTIYAVLNGSVTPRDRRKAR